VTHVRNTLTALLVALALVCAVAVPQAPSVFAMQGWADIGVMSLLAAILLRMRP